MPAHSSQAQHKIARPYARALFEFARDAGQLEACAAEIALLAQIARDPATLELVNNPRVSNEKCIGFFTAVAGGKLTPAGVNLLKLLAHHGRLAALPALAEIFTHLRAEFENQVNARMTTAAKIDSQQQKQFTDALAKKLGRRVSLSFAVDKALIGGAVIRVDDWVIDASVKTQLAALAGAVRV